MKKFSEYGMNALLRGVLVILPIYLTALLILKAMKSLTRLIGPFARLLPDWFPADRVLSFLLVVILCLIVGMVVETSVGQAMRQKLETSALQKVPGYTLFRSMSRQLAGIGGESAWRAALVEIEEALVPAVVIEELNDGSFTVFVPSAPTPMAGAVFILAAHRVHLLDVPFTHVFKAVAQWGSGTKKLIAALDRSNTAVLRT